MIKQSIQWKLSTQISNKYFYLFRYLFIKNRGRSLFSSDGGFTLIELLIAMAISAIVLSLALFGSLLNRQIYLKDQARNEVAQTLRLPLDIIGNDIKQAGEGIGTSDPNFPVILLATEPTQLIMRRQLIQTSLPVCRDITAGTSDAVVVMDQNSGSPLVGCEVGSLTDSDSDGWPDSWDDLERWRDYRSTQGGSIRAFIYNGNGQGEFFTYDTEDAFDAGANEVASPTTAGTDIEYVSIGPSNASWTNSYLADSSSRIYLIEERRYQLEETDEILQLVINDDELLPISNNIGLFGIEILLEQEDIDYTCTVLPPSEDADCTPTLPNPYFWSQIKSIDVTMQVSIDSSQANLLGKECADINDCPKLQLSRKFVPRNVFNF